MGKVKQGKRLGLNRDNAAGYSTVAPGDPMGAKLPLADEIESLKLAKTKTVDPKAQINSLRKRQADDEEVGYGFHGNHTIWSIFPKTLDVCLFQVC